LDLEVAARSPLPAPIGFTARGVALPPVRTRHCNWIRYTRNSSGLPQATESGS